MAKMVLIPVVVASAKWNQLLSRKEKEKITNRLAGKIHSKDVGQAFRYHYGNLYPKTKQAIRRYLS